MHRHPAFEDDRDISLSDRDLSRMGAQSLSLQTKIIALVIAIVAGVLSLSTYLNVKLSERTFEQGLEERAVSWAQVLAASIGTRQELEDPQTLQGEIEEIKRIRRKIERIEVVAFTKGAPVLVASTGGSSKLKSESAPWAEVGQGRTVSYLDSTQGRRLWDVAAPIRLGAEVVGGVKIKFSLEEADQLAAAERRQSLAIMLVAAVLIAGGLGWYLRRNVSRPIQTLVRSMATAEAGDLGVEAEIAREDELGRLARSFNRMLRRIEESSKENARLLARIETFNKDLEAEVERATHELAVRHEELRQAHAQLFEVQRDLSRTERLAMAGELAAMVAHEISTPLHLISGHVQLLLQETHADGKTVAHLRTIEAQIIRVVEILQTLLTASSPAEPLFKRVDLNRLVGEILDLMAPILSRRGVAVDQAIDPDLPSVVGDATQIQQVLLNLIANALDAMPDGGTLKVATRRAPCPEHVAAMAQRKRRPATGELPLTAPHDVVEIRLSDTGQGISPQHLDRIFEPFFTTKQPGKGTGLGLSICRRIVKAHGGRIEVDSRVGAGTTFTIALPAAKG